MIVEQFPCQFLLLLRIRSLGLSPRPVWSGQVAIPVLQSFGNVLAPSSSVDKRSLRPHAFIPSAGQFSVVLLSLALASVLCLQRRPDLLDDDRFANNTSRVQNRLPFVTRSLGHTQLGSVCVFRYPFSCTLALLLVLTVVTGSWLTVQWRIFSERILGRTSVTSCSTPGSPLPQSTASTIWRTTIS